MLEIVMIVISVWIAVAVVVAFALGRAAHIGKMQHAREVQAGWNAKRPIAHLPIATPQESTPAPSLARLG